MVLGCMLCCRASARGTLVFAAVLLYYAVVCGVVRSCAEPATRRISAHLRKVPILVTPEALGDLAFPYKWFAIV